MSRRKHGDAVAKADDELRDLVRPLWSASDASIKLGILAELDKRSGDMADLRAAQPVLCMLFADPDPHVARAAVALTAWRADMGADIRLALPSLALAAEHPDAEVRRLVWTALSGCDERHDKALAALAGVAARLAEEDPDPAVRGAARGVANRVAAVP